MELYESASLSEVEKQLLSDRYGIGKSTEAKNNVFLCNAMKSIRANRELIHPDNAFTYYTYGELGLLWIQTLDF